MPITYTKLRSDPILYSLKNVQQQNSPAFSNKTLAPILNGQDKSIMIDRLIHAAADIINSIKSKRNTRAIPTTQFISEILKRSRATYAMLQLALFYMFRIKKTDIPVKCARRIFLAALIIASKYLNDKNYKNKAWAKITNLSVNEINITEIVFLKLIDYQLYVSKPLYDKWVSLLHNHIKNRPSLPRDICFTSNNIRLPSVSPSNVYESPSNICQSPSSTHLPPSNMCLPRDTSLSPVSSNSSASDTSSPPSTPPPTITCGLKRPYSYSPLRASKHQRQF